VRIAGQLIDTATGAHIWADRFDGTLGDIFELQDQVAASVAGAIEPKLRLAEMARARRKPTESLDAYDLYLRAMAQALKRTREGLGESIRLSRRALELDPGYVPAMGRIAGSRGMQLVRRWIPPSGPEVEDGIHLARQAIAVADDAQSLASAAVGLSLLAGDNKTALAALDRAIALNPNSAPALSQRALILVHLARFDEAILSAQQAVRLSPLDPGLYPLGIALGLAHLAVGRYEEGLLWAEKSWRENGGLPAIRLILTLCGHLGRQQEADDCLQQMRGTFRKPTIADLISDLSRFLPPEILARYAEGLRKAGVPER
jgi:tetratricopeptide (TPR) repeat protein